MARRPHTRLRMLSTRCSTFFGELHPTPRAQHAAIMVQWKRGHPWLGSRPPFGSKHAQLVSSLDSELGSPWSPHPVVPGKVAISHAIYGLALLWAYTECHPKRSSFREAYYRGEAQCSICGRGFHLALPVHSLTLVNGTIYHDWGAMITIHGLDGRMYQSLPLPAAYMSTAITVKWSEVRFITEDTVPLVPEVISFEYFPQRMVASPVIESQS